MRRLLAIWGVAAMALLGGSGLAAQEWIEVELNGETSRVEAGTTLLDLVSELGRRANDVEITLNGHGVDRDSFADEALEAGDSVEIVEADTDDRYALGFGLGLINLDEERLSDDVEPFFNLHLRIRFGERAHQAGDTGIRGYLEPEIGYWTSDNTDATGVNTSGSDLLVGVNVIGVIPMESVDFFVGAGAGIHFVNADVTIPGQATVTTDDEALGVNAQFGVDVHLSRSTTIFGVGRFDIVDDTSNSLEAKVYLGLRFIL